jgi:hypothetical protein
MTGPETPKEGGTAMRTTGNKRDGFQVWSTERPGMLLGFVEHSEDHGFVGCVMEAEGDPGFGPVDFGVEADAVLRTVEAECRERFPARTA